MSGIVHPHYIRIIERQSNEWRLKKINIFCKGWPLGMNLEDFELLYGISKNELILELLRVKNGKPGHYIIDFLHKKYYYCGLEFESVKNKLLEIGIGRKDPTEN